MSSQNKKLEIRLDANNVLETEFANMRQHFEDSMRQMDQDLHSFFSTSFATSNSSINQNKFSKNTNDPSSSAPGQVVRNLSNWLESSIINTDENSNKSIRMRFDLHEFSPDEVTVNTSDGKVVVHARHEETSGPHYSLREYRREVCLPRGVNSNEFNTTFSADGILTVGGPLSIQDALRTG